MLHSQLGCTHQQQYHHHHHARTKRVSPQCPLTRCPHTPHTTTLLRASKRPDWATSPDDAEPSQPIDSVFVTRPNLTTDDLTSPFARGLGSSSTQQQQQGGDGDWRSDLRQLSSAISQTAGGDVDVGEEYLVDEVCV